MSPELRNPGPSPEQQRRNHEQLQADFVRDAGAETVGLTVGGLDGAGKTFMTTRRMSSEGTLLRATHPDSTIISLTRSLDRQIDNPAQVVDYVESMPSLSAEQVMQRSAITIAQLRRESLALSAPVPAGSEGKEAFDKTQRDRKMFEGGSGGANKHESYATELFAGTLSPEVVEHIAKKLDGKVVFNLGGGNSRIGAELAEHGASTTVLNIEPYPSDKAKDGQDKGYDHLVEANPARADFFADTEIPAHSADEVWAVFSVPAYLGTPEEVSALFNNISTMLKPGGKARISHLGVVGAAEGDPRLSVLMNELEKAKDDGYLLETTKTSRGITLLLTAPETASRS